MRKIDGKKIAERILEKLAATPPPQKKFLGAALVGNNPASEAFLKKKQEAAKAVGVEFRLYQFPEEISGDVLRRKVREIALHTTCGGFLLQLPLPPHINPHYVANVIPREKDVDVLGERARGAFYNGRNSVCPPAVGVVEEVLREVDWRLEEKLLAVVGLGFLVGRPIAVWAMRRARNTLLFHKDSDFALVAEADLVVTGVGKSGVVRPEMLREGAGVIDFGYDQGRGDLAPECLSTNIAFYTPTPGGTGPILVAKLIENFVLLNAPAPRPAAQTRER